MIFSGRRSHLTALLTAVVAFVGLLSLSSAPAWAAAGTINEFFLPAGSGDPIGITAGPDGNLWFTAFTAIGRITTSGGVTGFPVPQSLSEPQFITAGRMAPCGSWSSGETRSAVSPRSSV